MNSTTYERTTNPLPWGKKGMVAQRKFTHRYNHDYTQLGIYDMSVFEDEEL